MEICDPQDFLDEIHSARKKSSKHGIIFATKNPVKSRRRRRKKNSSNEARKFREIYLVPSVHSGKYWFSERVEKDLNLEINVAEIDKS